MHKKYRHANKERYEKVKADERRASAKFRKTDKWRLGRIRYRNRKREFIFSILGDKCVKCGFSDRRALQIDHIHGRNGEKRLGNIDKRYIYIKKNPKEALAKYQILCANCNFIKRDENDEYFYHGKKRLL